MMIRLPFETWASSFSCKQERGADVCNIKTLLMVTMSSQKYLDDLFIGCTFGFLKDQWLDHSIAVRVGLPNLRVVMMFVGRTWERQTDHSVCCLFVTAIFILTTTVFILWYWTIQKIPIYPWFEECGDREYFSSSSDILKNLKLKVYQMCAHQDAFKV